MTLANKLTLSRVVVAPVILLVSQLDFPHAWTVAAALYTLAALTDILDGSIARKQGTVSGFGKIFDPIADKVLVLAALLPLMLTGRLPLWAAFIIIAREFIISAVRIQVTSTGGAIISASLWGKLKTIFQDIFLVMMFLEPDMSWLARFWVTDLFFWLAMALTVWSLGDYCWKNRSAFEGA